MRYYIEASDANEKLIWFGVIENEGGNVYEAINQAAVHVKRQHHPKLADNIIGDPEVIVREPMTFKAYATANEPYATDVLQI